MNPRQQPQAPGPSPVSSVSAVSEIAGSSRWKDHRAALSRREMLVLGATPRATGLIFSKEEVSAAQRSVAQSLERSSSTAEPFRPSFFSESEFRTVRLLCDLFMPADERSGSAAVAGVPRFIDFIMLDPLRDAELREVAQTSMRGGLAWLDRFARTCFARRFTDLVEAEYLQIMDLLFSPDASSGPLTPGAAFMSRFGDLVASGVRTNKIGTVEMTSLGNGFVPEGARRPDEALGAPTLGARSAVRSRFETETDQ